MIQNNSLSSQTKFNQNQIKNTEVKKIRYQTALVGLLGRPKNSCSYSKLILCCSLPNVTPYNKFQPNRMKNAKVKIFVIFENSAKAKLSKLEPFAWSHWIRKYLFYLRYKFRPRSRPAPKMAQLSQTSSRKNWKTSFLNKDQKVELVIRLFSDNQKNKNFEEKKIKQNFFPKRKKQILPQNL